MALFLKIVSPEKVEFEGDVKGVVVSGTQGQFEILINHAPIISSLEKGTVSYETASGEKRTLDIYAGFVSVMQNQINVCIEKL
ncbi:MAG: F0F1 ATP synthase subunit epsilon [Prevotella sp.]